MPKYRSNLQVAVKILRLQSDADMCSSYLYTTTQTHTELKTSLLCRQVSYIALYTRVYVLLRVTGNNNAHAFPLWAASNANRSATTQRLEEEPGITNYAWYVQEVANKPNNRKDREWARPRSFERCCTRRHTRR